MVIGSRTKIEHFGAALPRGFGFGGTEIAFFDPPYLV
jgi:hypothetical protein